MVRRLITKFRIYLRWWIHREVFYDLDGNPILVNPKYIIRIDQRHTIYESVLIKHWIRHVTRSESPYKWVTSKQVRSRVLSNSVYYEYNTGDSTILVELKRWVEFTT